MKTTAHTTINASTLRDAASKATAHFDAFFDGTGYTIETADAEPDLLLGGDTAPRSWEVRFMARTA